MICQVVELGNQYRQIAVEGPHDPGVPSLDCNFSFWVEVRLLKVLRRFHAMLTIYNPESAIFNLLLRSWLLL